MHSGSRIPFVLLVAAALGAGACNWLSLAHSALTYRELQPGEAGNVAARDSLVYVTLGGEGLAVLSAQSGDRLVTLAPAAGSGSADDLAIADDLLFVLDARAPGTLSVYSLRDPVRPRLVSPPRPVPVEPFSGVSARAGWCVVSGGTSELTAWRYDSLGLTGTAPATTDLGRGQPDVLVGPDGLVYVSTHYWGPHFGLDIVRADDAAAGGAGLVTLAALMLDGAGFTAGGAKPANFPIEAAAVGRDTVLVAHAGGVAVIDVSRPARPRLLRTIDVSGPAVNVDALGDVAAVAVSGPTPALVLLSLAGGHSTIVRRLALEPGTFLGGVALTATHATVAVGNRGVHVFER